MKTLAIIILALAFTFAVSLLAAFIAMVLVGGIGHIFNITTFLYLSYWEIYILMIIFGFMGIGIGSSNGRN